MLFRRRPEPEPQASDRTPFELPRYGPTKDEIAAIADFINQRLDPITPPMIPRPDDTGRALLALGHAARIARHMGDALVDQGTSAIMEWAILYEIAHYWRDHPDYRTNWDPAH